MTKRGLLLWVSTLLLLSSAVPSWAAPAPKTGPKAGNISALLPVAKITRGTGKQAVTTDAKKGDELVWNDLVKTEKGGRARITLADQSILSLGSQAELRIVRHDARSQQTALEMAYGRVRAQVASITRDGGKFELRTPTAVAGVIGTDFGVDSSSVGGDTFVCIAGAVQVSSGDKSIPGSVQCTAGQTTTVQPGKPPTPPQPASPQQIQKLIEDTEPAIISSMVPAGGLPGASFDTTVAGQNMAAVNSVSIAGAGVTATLKSASATSVQVHVEVAASAAPGPRTITLAKQSGASAAAVFTVLGPPTGDLKTGYTQTLQQLMQTGLSSLSGFTTGAQQSADQVAQAVTNANLNLPKPIDLSPFATALNQQYGTVSTGVTGQTSAIQTAQQNAAAQFQAAYDAAYQDLLKRDASGKPDSTFTNAVAAAFQSANAMLQGSITEAQSALSGTVQTFGTSINQLQQDWIQNINAAQVAEGEGPTPKVSALERDVDLGAVASFDASGSSATNGASILSTNWVLCSQSYQPKGFGTPLDPSTAACSAIPGIASTQPDFEVPTCSLSPGTYYARLTLTDSNNKVTPMDVKLVVVQPSYGTPTQAVRGLADAYSSLQLSQFMGYFDRTAPGTATLFLNMQSTMNSLNSMSINIISSQDTVTCNDAVTVATWQQNYTFKNNINSVLTTDENLRVTLHRTPGTGWLVTTLSGDNGTVAGVPPGPIITDQPGPDLVVSTTSLGSTPLTTTAASGVSPGTHTISTTITNVGNANLISLNMPVVVNLMQGTTTIATATQNMPPTVSQGGTSLLTFNLQFPQGADGTPLTLVVNVNPGCTIPEKVCDGNNQQNYPLQIQNNVINLTQVTPSLSVSPGGPAGTISMNVSSTIYPVQVCSSVLNGIDISASSPGPRPSGSSSSGSPVCKSVSQAGPLTFTVAASLSASAGLQNDLFTATNAGDPAQGIPPATATVTVPVTVVVAHYVISSLNFAGHTPPYTGANALQVGESTQILVTITNTGGATLTGSITVTADCGVPTACKTVTSTIAAPAAGSSVSTTLDLQSVDLPVATYAGTATLTTAIPGAIVDPPTQVSFDVVDFDFQPVTMSPSQNLPIGGTGNLGFTLTEHVPSGSPFAIPITPVGSSTLSFVPSTQTTSAASVSFLANIGAGMPPTSSPTVPDTITVNAVNHGVTKTATVPVNYFNAQLVPQNIFVNDSANPLTVPVAAPSGPPVNPPSVNLRMSGNYIGGPAPLTITNPTCASGLPASTTPSSAAPGDPVDMLNIYATGSTCTSGQPLLIQAAIPNTNPSTPLTVYTLYVYPKGLAQLQVVSPMASSRPISSSLPWLAGEPMDWTVTVKNVGSGPSAGNESIVLSLNGGEIGRGTLTSPIAPGSTGSVTIHTDAPDVPADASFGPLATLSAHVNLDTQGDLQPGTGDLSQSVNVSNWSIGVNGAGSSDSTPLALTVGQTQSGTANVVINSPGTFNPALNLPLVLGSYSSGQLTPSSFSPATISASVGSTVTVNMQSGQTPVSGAYFAQVIAQMKDGSNVTTQRQATIHVSIQSSTYPAFVVLASDQGNIAQCDGPSSCPTPSTLVQVNGPLPSTFTLTASLSFCSSGPCAGAVDVGFTDTFMTNTTPQVSTINVTSPGNTLATRVKAPTNPDGSITTGTAVVIASVSAIQVPSGAARTPTPEPVGTDNFSLGFNIGDIQASSSACIKVPPVGPSSSSPVTIGVPVALTAIQGFNIATAYWEWEDASHLPVQGSPLLFSGTPSGTATLSGSTYNVPSLSVTNVSTGVDGLQTYYFAVTVSNGVATATKYFPFTFDLSQSQTFCPVPTSSSRGSFGGQIIRGSWGKAGLMGAAHSSIIPSGNLPDLRISASDVSFTPSMPKTGDVVSVRFKISNVGDTDAHAVPVGLVVNGTVVASDKFDIPRAKTVMGALQWNNAQIPSVSSAPASTGRVARGGRDVVPSTAAALTSLNASIVIDPRQTMRQKTTMAKSAPLAHFSLHEGTAATVIAATRTEQRVVLELGEGACAGLRFKVGTSGCNSGDVSISVEDLAKGIYKLDATNGIADLGMASLQTANANVRSNFAMQAVAQNGHTYAVQLNGGAVGYLTVTAVRNPNQLSEAAQRLFRRGAASKLVRNLGTDSAVPEPQTKESKVYFDILYQGE